MSLLEALEASLTASEKRIAALMLRTYSVLNKEFKFVESRAKRTQAYHCLIDAYCKEKCGAINGVDRNSTMVRLNVGGKVHIMKRSTMLLEGDNMNFLCLMVSGRWDYLLPRDRNGVIFIDLDPALITPILDKFRFRSNYGTTKQLILRISVEKRAIFNSVVSYYRTGDLVYNRTAFSEESTIECMNDPRNILLLRSFLPSDLTEMRLKFELLYRGTRDGMTAAAFHRLCDGKNDTICVIKDSNGNVFGGFADKAWSTQNSWVKSEKSFLFSLKSSLGNEVVKFPVNTGHPYALYHDASYMCAFGNGDLHIILTPGKSSLNIGTSYQNPSSAYSRQYCTGGHLNFQLHEIEVYQVIQDGSKAPARFNADDMPINLTLSIKTEQSPLEAVSESIEVSNVYTTHTSDLASSLLHMSKVAQMSEGELLLELMWIEHLSVPMSKRNLSTGLLAEWQRICEESADVLPLSNGVVVTSYGSETLKRIEESIASPQNKIGLKRKRDSSESRTMCSGKKVFSSSLVCKEVDTTVDDVISFNVGGTIIAILRSTLLLQAPRSIFAASYSDRWLQRADELDECGNIYMVKDNHSLSFNIVFFLSEISLSLFFSLLLCFFLP